MSNLATEVATIIEGHIEGLSTPMLVDTGSATTLLRDDLWREIVGGRERSLQYPPFPVMAANGQNLQLLGQSEVTIEVELIFCSNMDVW